MSEWVTYIILLKVNGYTFRGSNFPIFIFASLSQSLVGSKFFTLRVNSIEKESKYINDRVTSPEGEPIAKTYRRSK